MGDACACEMLATRLVKSSQVAAVPSSSLSSLSLSLSLARSLSLSLSLSLSVSVSPLSLLSLWYPLSLSLVTSLTHYPTLFARVAYSIAI